MEALSDDNKKLFVEQINDHVEKLNELMGMPSGKALDEKVVRKVCLATKLLEGSTGMLCIRDWSRTLGMLRDLLSDAALSGGNWDESMSQVVSEVLEIEEKVIAEILTGEIEEIIEKGIFSGIQCEMEALLSDTSKPCMEEIPSVRIEEEGDETCTGKEEAQDGFLTLDKLIGSLYRVKDQFKEFYEEGNQGEPVQREMENAFGESEFYLAMLRDIICKLGDSGRPFLSKVSSGTVLDGVRDFINLHGKLRGWNVELVTRCDDFVLERVLASDLACILENCLFDVCRMYEGRSGFRLSVNVEIKNEGSYLVTRISDNGPDFMSDSEIDREDVFAFYKGLINVRNLLEGHGGLLWVEPGRDKDIRFQFTLPHSSIKTDYVLFNAGGRGLAIPRYSMDAVVGLDQVVINGEFKDRYMELDDARIPVYRFDELAHEEMSGGGDGGNLMIVGIAEKRIGFFLDEQGGRTVGIQDQLTEENWASLTRHMLHLGEKEYPVLDVRLMLKKVDYLRELDGSPDESGCIVSGSGFLEREKELTVPRV